MKEGVCVPSVTFKYRVRTDGQEICHVDKTNGGANPFEWCEVTSREIFEGKRVVVFSLPGAFTPTCSTMQVPGFEDKYWTIRKEYGIDEVYVISVNDTFTMRKWMIDQNVKNLKFIPDGNGEFTRQMGMLVDKSNLGFGMRSWRYAMIVNDGVIEEFWEEPGRTDNAEEDPYVTTDPDTIITYLQSNFNRG